MRLSCLLVRFRLTGNDPRARACRAPFGPLTDAQWRHLTVHVTRPTAEGGFEMGYDPDIGKPLADIEISESSSDGFGRQRRGKKKPTGVKKPAKIPRPKN